jgi:hypothetical protein
MKTIKAIDLKKGQMICENSGMCFEILSAINTNNQITITVDNRFSPRMKNVSTFKKNQLLNIVE